MLQNRIAVLIYVLAFYYTVGDKQETDQTFLQLLATFGVIDIYLITEKKFLNIRYYMNEYNELRLN